MSSKLARIFVAGACLLATAAVGQTSSAALPSAPSAAGSEPAASPVSATGGTRIATLNIEQAIIATNEGQREFEALGKKLEPKQTQLKSMSDELDSLKKQLNSQGDNDQNRGTLVKQIEQKQKLFDRSLQDAQDESQSQRNEIAQKILQKMGPIILKYAKENGFAVLLDVSQTWPQGPVVWYDPASVDITKPIVDAYNAQSGVAPPPRPAATAPARPATTPATKPASTTTPK